MSDAFISLARKWRPRLFADLTGQEYVVRALQNAARQNRLHHALLFTGTRGVGKTTLARIVAMLVNCEQRHADGDEPCLQCPSCRNIIDGRLTDVMELDAASHTQVDKMRELLEGAVYAPVSAKYKVFIIDEAHMLSKSAFNAMLKTLEEPPSHVKFILATTDPQKLPITVRSRCLCFSLLPLTKQQISGRLVAILSEEGVKYEDTAVREVARLADGSMRDALSILDQGIAHGGNELRADDLRRITGDPGWTLLGEIMAAVADGDAARIKDISAGHIAGNIDFDSSLKRLASLIYDTALTVAVPTMAPDDGQEAAIVADMAGRLSAEELQVLYEIAVRGRRQLPLAPDAETGFEMTLLRMMLFVPKYDGTVPPVADGGGKTVNTTTETATPLSPPPSPVAVNGKAGIVQSAVVSPLNSWSDVEARLSDKARALTMHCLADDYTAAGVRLRLDKSHATIAKMLLPQLRRETQDLLGGDFAVHLTVADNDAAAVAQQEHQLRAAQESPLVKEVLSSFTAARILPESIKIAGE